MINIACFTEPCRISNVSDMDGRPRGCRNWFSLRLRANSALAWVIRVLPILIVISVLHFVATNTFRNPAATLTSPGHDYATYNGRSRAGPAQAPWMSCPQIPRTMSRPEHDSAIRLLADLSDLFSRANITYSMNWGTLIGSYLFHDIIPWDDDVDIMVDYDDLPKVKKLFKNVTIWKTWGIHSFMKMGEAHGHSEYDLATLQAFPDNASDAIYYHIHPEYTDDDPEQNFHKFKFYRRDSGLAGKWPWRWPFVDVTFIREVNGYLVNVPPPKQKPKSRYPRNIIYPLTLRPLGSLWLPAPRDVVALLRTRYDHFVCSTQDYTHRHESWIWWWNRYSVDCDVIKHYYPIVTLKSRGRGHMIEQLRLGDELIQELRVPVSSTVSERPDNRPLKF